MNKDGDPYFAFDWYFSDASETDSARSHTLKHKQLETKVLVDLISADSILHFALWSELSASHPVGELWLETQTDLLATIYLSYGGFYRQALTALRAWYEIALLGVYFSGHYGQPNGRYEQWRNGVRNAPLNISAIADSLAKRSDKIIAVSEDIITSKLQPSYNFLADQAHGRGLNIHDLQAGKDNVPRFLPESFDIWYSKLLDVFNAVCFLYRVFFTLKLSSYLKKYKQEEERALVIAAKFAQSMPDCRALIEEACIVSVKNK
ncbi:MAG: hypothetical protein ACYDCJ_10385 [Gammaproteobacteria bacterium]